MAGMKQTIKLESGTLELSPLWKGRLIIGALSGTVKSDAELYQALRRAGIRYGYLKECIPLLRKNNQAQVPLALASVTDTPGRYRYLFEKASKDSLAREIISHRRIPSEAALQMVSGNQSLTSMELPPQSVLQLPDGTRKEIEQYDAKYQCYFAGDNTRYSDNLNALTASIDGSAAKNAFGEISVYPLKKLKSIGNIHGIVSGDFAYEIEADVHSASQIESPSNILIHGMVHSSEVTAGGQVYCLSGFDNMQKKDLGSVTAGHLIVTNSLRSYLAWSAASIFVLSNISSSIVHAYDSVYCPLISGSEIRVRNQLITNNVKDNSKIYIGDKFIKNPALKERHSFYYQHQNSINDLQNKLDMLIGKIEQDKQNIIQQLGKLRQLGKTDLKSDILLSRLGNNQKIQLKEFEDKLESYRRLIIKTNRERFQLLYHEHENELNRQPCIMVYGAIAAGTTIAAPNQILKLKNEHRRVKIELDPLKGTLSFSELDKGCAAA